MNSLNETIIQFEKALIKLDRFEVSERFGSRRRSENLSHC